MHSTLDLTPDAAALLDTLMARDGFRTGLTTLARESGIASHLAASDALRELVALDLAAVHVTTANERSWVLA